jgi:hypothetical protein
MDNNDAAERSLRIERHIQGLIEALERLRISRAGRSLQWPQPRELTGLLFSLLEDGCGEEAARQLFIEQGQGKERRELQKIDNQLFLDCFDLQKELAERSGRKFTIARFLRDWAKANESRPRNGRIGGGSTDTTTLRQQLRILRIQRDLERALAGRDHAERELVDLQRVRKGAIAHADDLTAIRAIDKRTEEVRKALIVLNDRIATLRSGKDIVSDL